MNGKRSYWKLLMAGAGVGLLITNCTVKSESDSGTCTVGSKSTGCMCAGNAIGSQTCLADGTYGACVCATESGGGAGGSTSSTGGSTSSTGGSATAAGTGGTATATAGSVGYAGAAGATDTGGAGGASACSSGISTADDCYDCLGKACATQRAACEAEDEGHPDSVTGDYCLKNNPAADPGQMDAILDCIATERGKLMAAGKTVVKRDIVRACGSTIGVSSDPSNFIWAPQAMTKATKDLMNCMADAPAAAMPGAWADSNDPASFSQDPDGGLPSPLPWADCTCAKTSCTSPL